MFMLVASILTDTAIFFNAPLLIFYESFLILLFYSLQLKTRRFQDVVFVAWCQEVQNIVQHVCVRFDMQCHGTSPNCWSCVWQVMDCVADTLENVDRGVRWIIEMSQRKWCVTSVGWRQTIHIWCASPLWADGKLFTSVGWQSVDGATAASTILFGLYMAGDEYVSVKLMLLPAAAGKPFASFGW